MTDDDDPVEMLRDALGRPFGDLLNESSDPLVVAEVVIGLRELVTGDDYTLSQLRHARTILQSVRREPRDPTVQ